MTPDESVIRSAELPDHGGDELLSFYGECFGALPALAKRIGHLARVVVHQRPGAPGHTWHRFTVEDGTECVAAGDDGEWRLTGLAWQLLDGAATSDDRIELVPYDPSWPARYCQLQADLTARLPAGLIRRWEHYGSTAVPGLSAKPVIDLLAEPAEPEAARAVLLGSLAGPACEYWRYDQHDLFVGRQALGGPRLWHLHLAAGGDRLWRGLAFRDRLRADGELAREYERLKQQLSRAHGHDRERYTQAKTEFILAHTPSAASPEPTTG